MPPIKTQKAPYNVYHTEHLRYTNKRVLKKVGEVLATNQAVADKIARMQFPVPTNFNEDLTVLRAR